MTSSHAIAVDDQGVATLTIAGRKALNIIGTPEITALTAALQQLANDPRLRVLVLRGRDDQAWIGGADIHEMALLTPDTAAGLHHPAERPVRGDPAVPGAGDRPAGRLVPGRRAGGGAGLRPALASSQSQYGMPEVKVGIPSVIHAAMLPRRVGMSAATWLLLTGETIGADEALRIDLLHQVHAPEALDAAVQATARQLAGLGPQVLRQQKRLLRDWERLPLETSIQQSVAEFARAFTTGEPQQHMQAFLQRRR
jgi:enoyl-CoA hydratase